MSMLATLLRSWSVPVEASSFSFWSRFCAWIRSGSLEVFALKREGIECRLGYA